MLSRALVPIAWLGRRLLLNTDARRTLELRILPTLAADPTLERVLFVGCEWYTWRYTVLFRKRQFWTIERRAAASRRYGGSRAIADEVQHLDRHVAPSTFDLIVCNGVFGWGLDTAADATATIDQFHRALRPGGLLVMGWTNGAGHRPMDFDDPASVPGFVPQVFTPLGTSRWLTTNEPPHVFSFFART